MFTSPPPTIKKPTWQSIIKKFYVYSALQIGGERNGPHISENAGYKDSMFPFFDWVDLGGGAP